MLKILGKSTSINVRKVLWTCHELGLDYSHEEYGGDFKSTTTEEFKALNPNSLVPVIIDDEYVLWESILFAVILRAEKGATICYRSRHAKEPKSSSGWTGS